MSDEKSAGREPPDEARRGREIQAEVVVRATPAQAWQAWADPEKLAGWFVDRAYGEGRTGETMIWVFERFGMEIPYRVIESVPGERIAFGPATDDVPPFVLDIRISRHHGETHIRLVNSGFSEDADFDDQFSGIDSGWRMALGVLTEYLERHFGEQRRAALVIRPASYEPGELHGLFVEAQGLARWLGSGGPIGAAGAPVELDLVDGGRLTGRVLANTGTEVAVSWEEIGGILELKAFTMDAGPMVGLRSWGWGMGEGDTAALEARLDRMVGRLLAALGVSSKA